MSAKNDRRLCCRSFYSKYFLYSTKNFSIEERKGILLDICKIFYVECIDIKKIKNAIVNEDFLDFEDCLQMECAKNFHADYIVSRNLADFKNCGIQCVAPDEARISTGHEHRKFP